MLGRSNEETNSWFGRLVRSGEFLVKSIYLFKKACSAIFIKGNGGPF